MSTGQPMADPEGHITLGDRLETMDDKLDALGVSMQSVMVKLEADYHKGEAQNERIKKLESWQEWANRLVVGAIILGLIGMVYAA